MKKENEIVLIPTDGFEDELTVYIIKSQPKK